MAFSLGCEVEILNHMCELASKCPALSQPCLLLLLLSNQSGMLGATGIIWINDEVPGLSIHNKLCATLMKICKSTLF